MLDYKNDMEKDGMNVKIDFKMPDWYGKRWQNDLQMNPADVLIIKDTYK